MTEQQLAEHNANILKEAEIDINEDMEAYDQGKLTYSQTGHFTQLQIAKRAVARERQEVAAELIETNKNRGRRTL